MVLPGEDEMEEDIWTVRRRRHRSPCRTSQGTCRARRSGEPDFPCPYFVTFLSGPSQIPLCSWFPCLLISVDFHSFREPVVKHHFTCDQQVHTLSPKERGCAPPPCPGCSVYVPTRILTSCLQVAFFNFAGASAQEEQRVCCQLLAHPVASSQRTPGTGGESVCGETHRALQGAMEKVQLSRSWHGPRTVWVGQGSWFLRFDPIILALEQLYGGQRGPEEAGGETRASIHPPLGTDTISEREARVHQGELLDHQRGPSL
ncbi:uncharacterized protein LOC126959235 [Macaca thibetana thibetana]|uniref:uncharacterized protein LOC126959235 n=1 Tax=Macaca thibetana thibetana TaxID=257877 RepID=UPI0021BC7DB9|nr:uncharacterized protein LOC126959235 [Macaca thibetana thibetana]